MKTKYRFLRMHRRAALTLALIAALVAVTGVMAAAGALDATFDGDGKVVTSIRDEDTIRAIAIQSDGRIVVAGESFTGSPSDFSLARYNSNGSLDSSFDGDGKVITDIRGEYNTANGIALQTDGKIVVAGHDYNYTNDFALTRYNTNGSLDSTFDGDGIVVTNIGGSDLCYAVAIQTDGKIVVAGASDNWGEYNFALARYNTNGSLDTTFDGDGKVVTSIGINDYGYAIAIQPDNKIIVAGQSYTSNNYDFSMARYNSNGSLDTTFDYDGKVVTNIRNEANYGYAIALQSGGKIVVAGTTGNDFALARYNSNGSLDANFDGDGIVVTDFGGSDIGEAVAIQSDGRIVMAGYSNRLGTYDLALTRYNVDGSPDTGFDGDGRVLTSIGDVDTANAIALQADGKIVAAGSSDGHYALARYTAAAAGGSLTLRSSGAYDGWILESNENSSVGGTLNNAAATFRLGDNAQDKQFRAILHFDTASLPDNAVFTKVTLKIKRQGLTGQDPFSVFGGLRVDIQQPFFGTNIDLVIDDFQAGAGKSAAATFSATPVNNWYSAVLNSAGMAYINRSGTTQFRLRFVTGDNDNNVADFMNFFSGNYASVSDRPTLIIQYDVPDVP